MRFSKKPRLVRAALFANAVFSLASGLALTLAPVTWAGLLGVQAAGVLRPLGLTLVAFAALVFVAANRRRVRPAEAVLISVSDVVWVLGTFVLLAVAPRALDETGVRIVLLVAALVGSFALAQLAGVRRYLQETERGLGPEAHL